MRRSRRNQKITCEKHVADITQHLLDQIATACNSNQTLSIKAGGSKAFMGRPIQADCQLDLSGHSGIVGYHPVELVMTARAGTPLVELEAALAEHNQMLAFEPPRFAGRGTLGGTLATNLSGPSRPWWGSIRDHILGVNLINGFAERLRFGGQVMKNVAGYDLSRLQAGAFGALGVMTEISFKVSPKPAALRTLKFQLSESEAIEQMNYFASQPKPLSAAYWQSGVLYVRLAGAASAVDTTAKHWGGDEIGTPEATAIWQTLQDQQLAIFNASTLWRFSVRSNAPSLNLNGDTLINWGGAERWVAADAELAEMAQVAETAGGQVSLYRGGDRKGEVLHPMVPELQRLQQRIKQAIDPKGIFNPGRGYSWL